MSDEKVRVLFTDADGNDVSAVMFRVPNRNSVHCPGVEIHGELSVTPIRELPTGVGAVVRVNKPQFSGTRDLYTHVGSGWWTNLEVDDVFATAERNGFDDKQWPWEVLSEGIQIGDVK